ncbi:pentatricopeptide repeat-containing protein At2g06000-like [Salvia miltiorrhiza]|uniref:pentatricopeptide repeat-containing protein At2g06000-like n=1 Tax=Salvia miltiorrhiza TaxID=226208 RepID=UPI0025ACF4A2|nr:pentatricopeptide repeat-containing protein At2g06000-like [Salvia miltiorrhiza]XP_057803917.1 pentatricopeptide repeat-containing protein At2g06000-like [Salvia miltiorrhiza]
MQLRAPKVRFSKIFATASFHGHARIESSRSASASTCWFIKVVSTSCIHLSRSLDFLETDYFRDNLNSLVAYGVVHRIHSRLNNPSLAFEFFRYSRLNLKLIHLESTYDLLLRSLCEKGVHDSAAAVYECMKIDGFWPNSSVLDVLVSALANAGKFRTAEEILIAEAEFCNEKEKRVSSFVYNNYLSILVNRNRINEAVVFFREHILRLRSFDPDTCSFNIVVRGLCRTSKVEKAFEFFDAMRDFDCYPDIVTYNTLINGFCSVGRVDRAEELLGEVKLQSGFSPNVVTYTTLISGYCKSGKLDGAVTILDEMINNGVRPNLFTFNTIINGFGRKGELASAMKMYERMVSGGFHPDVITFTSLIDGYCRLGDLAQGMRFWDDMSARKVPPNIFTFSILISALCKVNRLNEARDLLNQLNKREDIVPEPFVYNPVIDGYCKVGNVDEANVVVAEMEAKGCIHDKMTFTILIMGHCMKGRVFEGIGLYKKMVSVGCVPDNITVRSLISCLRKAGMAREANEIELGALNDVHLGSSSETTTAIGKLNVPMAV